MWNQGMSWENSTFSHPICISNKGWCTNCGPVKGRCSEVLEYLTTRCHIYGCVCHHCSHPAGCECWQQGKWGVAGATRGLEQVPPACEFSKEGKQTLRTMTKSNVLVKCVTSVENTASHVPSLLNTLNTFCGRFDNTAVTTPGEKERMSLSALPALLLRLQRHHCTDANRKTIHSGAQYFSGGTGSWTSYQTGIRLLWSSKDVNLCVSHESIRNPLLIETILNSNDSRFKNLAKNKANNGIETE